MYKYSFLSLFLISSYNPSAKADAIALPFYGISCTSANGDSIAVYPVNNGIEIDLVSPQFTDDNVYRRATDNPSAFVFEDSLSGVTISISGLEQENVTNTTLTYKNELMKYEATFSNCDVL